MKKLVSVSAYALFLGLLAVSSAQKPLSLQPQRLFTIPYGTSKGAVPLELVPGHPEYEPPTLEGPSGIVVSPDGSRILIAVWYRTIESGVIEELIVYDRSGKFIYNLPISRSTTPDKYKVPTLVKIDHVVFDHNNLLYVLRRGQISVYDAQGNFLESLSKIYNDSLNFLDDDKRKFIDIIGIDKQGSIYFITYGEAFKVDPKGHRTWIDLPFSCFYPNVTLAKGDSVLYLITGTPKEKLQSLRNPPPASYKVWNNRQGRYQTVCTVPSDPKIFSQLRQQYEDYHFRRVAATGQTYWKAFRHGKLSWSSIVTVGGKIEVATMNILIFDPDGRLAGKVPYFVASDTQPIGRSSVMEWDIDAAGNIYYLKWTEKNLEVWWVPNPSASIK